MMQNLYIDKLKGRITDKEYDKFYQDFKAQLDSVNHIMAQLEEANDNYEILVKHLLILTNQAFELFVCSEVDEKRQLIKLLLQNLRLDGKNMLYDVLKPFDLLAKCGDRQVWCARLDSNQRPTD